MKTNRNRNPVRGAAQSLLCVAALAPGAWGQLQERDALTPVIGGLPQSVGLVAVSSKPSAVLEAVSTPWHRLGPIAAGLGSETLSSWSALAKEIGYKPGEAFDALTSGGLAVVIAPPEGHEGRVKIEGAARKGEEGKLLLSADAEVQWAVLSVVKAEVAARVRERLRASPHQVIGGLPVLSVEGGRYALVCRGLGKGEGGGGAEVLALTPMEDRGFLASIVGAVEAARPRAGDGAEAKSDKGTLGATAAFARAKRTGADVLVLTRKGDGAPGEEWRSASVVACTLGEKSWTFDAVSADERAEGAAPAKLRPLPPEASALFDAWAPGAGVMVVGGGAVFDELERELAASGGAGGAAAFGADAAQLSFLKGLEAGCLYVGPSAANARSGRVEGGVSVWCAVRAKDRASLPVSVVDSLGPGAVAAVEHGWRVFEDDAPSKSGEVIDQRTLAAMPEYALRVVSVKLAEGGPLGGPVAGSTKVPGSVAWFVCPAAGANGDENGARWGAVGIEPRGDADAVGARHKGMTGVLSGSGEAKEGPLERAWLWRGVVRPAVLVDSFPSSMQMALAFSGIGSVKEVRFESWEEKEGVDAGERTKVVVEWK